jgi:hypothetical protein
LQTREDKEDEEEAKRKLLEIIARVSEKGKEMELGFVARQEKKKRKRREERKGGTKESMRRFGS